MDCPKKEELQGLCLDTIDTGREVSLMSHINACEDCQSALRGISDELAEGAPPLAKLAMAVDSQVLRARLADLKLQRRSPQSRHAPQHEDLQPWIDDGETEFGSVDHYDLIRCIGRGGMGVVFEAHDRDLDRAVAIKMMSPALLVDPSNRERFLREARAAAAINCPSVVTIYAVSTVRDLPYLCMELIDGESLQHRLDRGAHLDIDTIIDVARQVAEGLRAAHKAGVIHRDIKPANVLINSETGEVKITDFGLAYRAADHPLTQTGTLLGTPEYLAPEQIDGGASDARSDLFSLGSLLYHMCAGEPPFSSPSLVTTLHAVATSKPRPLADQDPRVPRWLSDLVEQLHEHDPEDRVQSADAVARALQLREFTPTRRKRAERKRRGVDSLTLRASAVVVIALTFVAVTAYVNRDTGRRVDIPVVAASAELIELISVHDGDVTVELDSNEPFHLKPLELSNRSVRLVAAMGRSPRLVFSDNAEKAAISCVDGRLELRGIRVEFVELNDPVLEESLGNAPLIFCEDAELYVNDCDVVGGRRTCVELLRSNAELIESRLEAQFDAIVCETTPPNRLDLHDCTIASDVGVRVVGRKNSLNLSDTEFSGQFVFEMDYAINPTDRASITVERNEFDCEKSVVAVNNTPNLFDLDEHSPALFPFRWESVGPEPADVSVTLFGEDGGQRLLMFPLARQ